MNTRENNSQTHQRCHSQVVQENEGTPTKEAKRTTEIVVGLRGVWRGCPATMPEGVDAPSPPGALELAVDVSRRVETCLESRWLLLFTFPQSRVHGRPPGARPTDLSSAGPSSSSSPLVLLAACPPRRSSALPLVRLAARPPHRSPLSSTPFDRPMASLNKILASIGTTRVARRYHPISVSGARGRKSR